MSGAVLPIVRSPIARTMLRHWREGLRDDAFHETVRDEFPFADLDTYNAAADEAWRALIITGGADTD